MNSHILWKGTIFNICNVVIAKSKVESNVIVYEFRDCLSKLPQHCWIKNFKQISGEGTYEILCSPEALSDVIDSLIEAIKSHYIQNTLVAYLGELNGIKH